MQSSNQKSPSWLI